MERVTITINMTKLTADILYENIENAVSVYVYDDNLLPAPQFTTIDMRSFYAPTACWRIVKFNTPAYNRFLNGVSLIGFRWSPDIKHYEWKTFC